jgi:hypothetical protein
MDLVIAKFSNPAFMKVKFDAIRLIWHVMTGSIPDHSAGNCSSICPGYSTTGEVSHEKNENS